MIDKVLKRALILHGNESCLLDNVTYQEFKTLLVELSKIKCNIRYCSSPNCLCHPETRIKKLLKSEKLSEFLADNKILAEITELVTNYVPVIAKGIYEDC